MTSPELENLVRIGKLKREPASSITSRCSTIEPAATAILVGSAPRHLNVPQFEGPTCLRFRGKSSAPPSRHYESDPEFPRLCRSGGIALPIAAATIFSLEPISGISFSLMVDASPPQLRAKI